MRAVLPTLLPLLLLAVLSPAAPARADPPARIWCSADEGPRHCIRADRFDLDLCAQIEAEAAARGIPSGFLARLLWQESRFRPRAVSPARARGIAQFIESTARLRGLRDPFNPAESVSRSAEYLAEMTRRYGNLGLAAAGYNGGERRVERFIAREGGFARETIDYVAIVTGTSVWDWRDGKPEPDMALADGPFLPACVALAGERTLRPMARPDTPAAGWAPWGVQVGYGRTGAEAAASYDRLQRGCRAAAPAAALQLVPVRSRIRGRPSYVMARLGHPERVGAVKMCRRIRAAGCVCAVYRNP